MDDDLNESVAEPTTRRQHFRVSASGMCLHWPKPSVSGNCLWLMALEWGLTCARGLGFHSLSGLTISPWHPKWDRHIGYVTRPSHCPSASSHMRTCAVPGKGICGRTNNEAAALGQWQLPLADGWSDDSCTRAGVRGLISSQVDPITIVLQNYTVNLSFIDNLGTGKAKSSR